MELKAYEDNETAVHAVKKGYSPLMRSLSRTFGVSVSRLNQLFHPDKHIDYLNDGRVEITEKGTNASDRYRAPEFLYRSMYSSLWMRDDPIDRNFMDATGFELMNCPTSEMRADGLTKFYETKAKWDYAVYMLGMKYSPDDDPVPPPKDIRKT